MRGGGAGGCVNTHIDTHSTRRMMPLICKLSSKVGQYVTNKRDFHILMPACTVWPSQQVGGTLRPHSDTQIPTEQQDVLGCSDIVSFLLKVSIVPVFVFFYKGRTRLDLKTQHFIWVPVQTVLRNDGQVWLVIMHAHRKPQHCPEETNWWWETAACLWW